MSSFIERLVADDFIWSAIVDNLPGRHKQSGTRYINFNCPMCIRRGENADKRMRCGVKHTPDQIRVSCFNCGFKTRWKPGELLSNSMREFLLGIGCSDTRVKTLNHKAMHIRSMFERSPEAQAMLPGIFVPSFPATSLPKGCKSIEAWAAEGCSDDRFLTAVDYLFSRGDDIASSTTFYWTPDGDDRDGMSQRIIVPYFYEGTIVGWSARSTCNEVQPRYMHSLPSNFLFNTRCLTAPNRKYVIICEGIFDALAVDGIGTMGAKLNQQQAAWIKSSGKIPIVLPDRDRRGQALIDVAQMNKWHVAFPGLKNGAGRNNWWDDDIKDAADACKRYGRLYTLMSIIETATDNAIKIDIERKYFL